MRSWRRKREPVWPARPSAMAQASCLSPMPPLPTSKAQQFFAVAAGERRDGRGIKTLHAGDVTDRIVFEHVERIIGAHDDMIGAEHADQFGKLVGREHYGVDIDALEIAR